MWKCIFLAVRWSPFVELYLLHAVCTLLSLCSSNFAFSIENFVRVLTYLCRPAFLVCSIGVLSVSINDAYMHNGQMMHPIVLSVSLDCMYRCKWFQWINARKHNSLAWLRRAASCTAIKSQAWLLRRINGCNKLQWVRTTAYKKKRPTLPADNLSVYAGRNFL